MSKRLSLALLLLALSGCDTMSVIGDRDDAGTMVDAPRATDDAYSADDAPRIADDAHRVSDDAHSTTDAYVVHGTGQFVAISASTSHPSFSSTPMDRFDVVVRVQEREDTAPSRRLIERSGTCDVNGAMATSGGAPALEVTSVTAQIGSAAAVPLTFEASRGYTLNTSPPPTGTAVIVRVDLGTRVIERTLVVRQMRMTTPTPIPASVQWRASYTPGSDVPFAWTGGATGTYTLVGTWDPLFINPAPERRDLNCALDGSTRSFNLPWALFNTHFVDPAASAPLFWLVNSESNRALEGDVTVQATSAALAEFTSLSPM